MADLNLQKNLEIYNAPDVTAYYAALNYLTPCERLLFDTYISTGSAILDLGVGGGRTTPYLASRAARYVGVDNAEAMVRRMPDEISQTSNSHSPTPPIFPHSPIRRLMRLYSRSTELTSFFLRNPDGSASLTFVAF